MSSVWVTVKRVATTMPPCSASEPAHAAGDLRSPASVASEILVLALVVITARLCNIGDQPDMGESRRADQRHDLHDAAVVHGFVAANEYALVVSVGCDSGQPRHQIIRRNARVLQKDDAVAPH